MAAPSQALTVGFLSGAPLGDESYNDSAFKGVKEAQSVNGFDLVVLQATPAGQVSQEELEDFLIKCDVVLMLGMQHYKRVKESAKAYPDKKFIFIHADIRDYPNISSVTYRHEEGMYLAGALAGLVTKTGTAGFAGGTRIPVQKQCEAGFLEGFKATRPDGKVMIAYVAQPGDFSGFSNPQEGMRIAEEMYRNGADIVCAKAGLSGNGVIEAARKTNKLAIGMAQDQDAMAKGNVLTSLIWRLDSAAYDQLALATNGKFSPGSHAYGLKENAFDLTPMKYTRHLVSHEDMKKLSDIRRKITTGEIIVPSGSK